MLDEVAGVYGITIEPVGGTRWSLDPETQHDDRCYPRNRSLAPGAPSVDDPVT